MSSGSPRTNLVKDEKAATEDVADVTEVGRHWIRTAAAVQVVWQMDDIAGELYPMH